MLLLLLLSVGLQTPSSEPRTVTISPAAPSAAMAPGSLRQTFHEGDRLICRTQSVVGSNRRQRVCMTAAQRAELQAQSKLFRDGMNSPLAPERPTDQEQILRGY